MKLTDYFESKYCHRIGNIELRMTSRLSGDRIMEIIKYYPNDYYGHESDYIYDEESQYYHPKGQEWHKIHQDLFKRDEFCYTIATIENEFSEEPDVITIGSRPYELTAQEWLNYKEIMTEFYRIINKDCQNDSF